MASMKEVFNPHILKITIPDARAIVYKTECVYSFDTPVSC